MNRKFRCGRLILSNDGTMKKLKLENGGGTRFCTWTHKYMDFKTVHLRLLNIFELNNSNCHTSLYDFKFRPLDLNIYKNLSQYIYKYGLNTNSTIIYLCTSENDNTEATTKHTVGTQTTTTFKEEQSTLIKTNWSKKSLNNEKLLKQQQLYEWTLEYGFKRAIENFIKKFQSLIDKNNADEIFNQLSQNMLMIRNYIISTIDVLQKKFRQSNDFIRLMSKDEILLYSNNINHIYNICLSTKELFMLNKKKFCHVQMFSIINNLCSQFTYNIENFREHWLKNANIILSS